MKLQTVHKVLVAAVLAAAANVVFLMAHGGSYDLHIGLLHSENAFKPLLILNGAFLLLALISRPREKLTSGSSPWLMAILVVAACGVMAASFAINPLDDDWNYRVYSSTHDSLSGVAHLFVSSQFGQWYRPVGFLSLLVDYALFHQHIWAYHFQQVLLHLANAFLVLLLAGRLGLTKFAARWAGALFLTAAVTFEAVLWPAARFDLWATLFTLAALLASAKFLAGAGRVTLALALACYALAVASKESAYAFPVLLTVMAASWPFEANSRKGPPGKKRRLIQLAAGVLLVTGVMLAIREAVLGIGGYASTATSPSPNLSFSLATIRILLARVMPWPMLAVNLAYPMPRVMLALIGAFAVLLALAAIAGASTRRRDWLLVLYVFAATLPVAPLIGWIDFKAMHARYLYMPAALMMMLAAAALANARRAEILLFAFGALNLGCGFYDTWVYKKTFQHSMELARGIEREIALPTGDGKPAQVEILGMPNEYNGVLFSKVEVAHRLEELVPGVKVTFQDRGACRAPLCYVWEPRQRLLLPVR